MRPMPHNRTLERLQVSDRSVASKAGFADAASRVGMWGLQRSGPLDPGGVAAALGVVGVQIDHLRV